MKIGPAHTDNQRLWWALLLTLVLSAAGRPALAAMHFDEALHLAKTNSQALAAAQRETLRQGELQGVARGLYFPKLTLEGRYTFLNDEISIDLDPLRQLIAKLHGLPSGALPSFEMAVQDDHYLQMDATVTWPVFTGGRILAANRAASAQHQAAEAAEQSETARLVSQVATRYFGLCLIRDVVNVRRQVWQAMQLHQEHAVRLEQNGMIARAERLHATVALAEAQRAMLAAEHDAQIALAALQNSLGTDAAVEPADGLFFSRGLGLASEFQQLARAHSPILRRLAAEQKTAEQGVKVAQGTRWPEIYLFGRRELVSEDLTILDPEWAAGVGARLTLFEGGARRHRIAAAQALAEKVACLVQDTRRNLDTLIVQRHHETAKAIEEFDALEAAADLGLENLRVRRRAFEEGLATSLDVVDAELSLARIRIERLDALYRFDTALAGLLEASGCGEDFETYRQRGTVPRRIEQICQAQGEGELR